MKTKYIIFLVYLVLAACAEQIEKAEIQAVEKAKSDQIVLIFKDPPSPWRVYREAGGYTPARCEVSYYDDNYIQQTYFPDSLANYDTLTIHSKRDQVEVLHTHQAFDHLSYIFRNGDTVLFSYEQHTPHTQILNRNEDDLITNYAIHKRQKIIESSFPALAIARSSFFFMYGDSYRGKENFKKHFQEELDRVQFLSVQLSEKELESETYHIDSLFSGGVIDQNQRDYFQTKSLFDHKQVLLFNEYSGAIREKNPKILNTMLAAEGKPYFLSPQNDSLLHYSFYRDILKWVTNRYYVSKVPRIKSSKIVDNQAVAGSNLPDYRAIYDSVSNNDSFSDQAAKMMLFATMENIVINHDIDDAREYFMKFEKQVKDSALTQYLAIRYQIGEQELDPENDLLLVSTTQETLTYNELIAKHQGKLIYVDFWASWCRPCLKEIPSLKEIEKAYADQEIVFVRISKDKENTAWIRTCEKYGIADNSYLVKNPYNSRQLERMQIDYIPHYLLYDQNGELIQGYAPRPSDPELVAILDQKLKNL
jgi:thiol-disulfide isomerase/thioredoxin